MTEDEKRNAVRQLCELIGYTRVISIAQDLLEKRFSHNDAQRRFLAGQPHHDSKD